MEAGPLPYEMSDELDTIGPCNFGGTLPGGFAYQADRATGELHAIAYFWAWDYVQHVIVDPAGKVSATTNIAVPDAPMMHDFALTGRYVVLLDLLVTFSLDAVTQGKELPGRAGQRRPPRPGRPAAPRRAARLSAGSRSSRAGCSIASTPTTTARARS